METIPLMLRLREDLHEKIKKESEKECRSLNNQINYIIDKYFQEKEKKEQK